MTAGSGNQGRYDPDEIVVHVAWVSKRGCTCGHYCGNLQDVSKADLSTLTS